MIFSFFFKQTIFFHKIIKIAMFAFLLIPQAIQPMFENSKKSNYSAIRSHIKPFITTLSVSLPFLFGTAAYCASKPKVLTETITYLNAIPDLVKVFTVATLALYSSIIITNIIKIQKLELKLNDRLNRHRLEIENLKDTIKKLNERINRRADEASTIEVKLEKLTEKAQVFLAKQQKEYNTRFANMGIFLYQFDLRLKEVENMDAAK